MFHSHILNLKHILNAVHLPLPKVKALPKVTRLFSRETNSLCSFTCDGRGAEAPGAPVVWTCCRNRHALVPSFYFCSYIAVGLLAI